MPQLKFPLQVKNRSIDSTNASSALNMRSKLLDAAADLFKAESFAAVSVAAVAEAAGAFPSQVTYYFGSKNAMFVEAACREILYVAQSAEQAASTSKSATAYRDALVRSTVGQSGLSFFLEALTLARHQPTVQPLIARTIERLHHEGERAFAEVRETRGWKVTASDTITAQRFWALVMSLSLRNSALGLDHQQTQNDLKTLLAGDFLDQSAAAHHPKKLGSKPVADMRTASQPSKRNKPIEPLRLIKP